MINKINVTSFRKNIGIILNMMDESHFPNISSVKFLA